MIGHERRILEKLCHSQARLGRGSTLCETHDCIKEITNWAQEHFIKLLSVKKKKVCLQMIAFCFNSHFAQHPNFFVFSSHLK